MTWIELNGARHYYEQTGQGPDLVWVHGAFVDSHLWEPQWEYFSSGYRLLRYDLRGHGRTGPSTLRHYTLDTFADDLYALLCALEITKPVVIGQSFGGSIAQNFSIRYPDNLTGLIMAGSMVAIDLTLLEKLLCRVLFPYWAMQQTIRLLNIESFIRFSLWLGRATMGHGFPTHDPAKQAYLEHCMLQMDRQEYLKLWEAFYNFHLLPLEHIRIPVLVINGEYEGEYMRLHTQEILRRIPQAKALVIPDASHASNLDNPIAFNQAVQSFAQYCISDQSSDGLSFQRYIR